jgi:Transposase and inactivated derivatives
MNAVGIDVSKGKSMIAVMRPFGEVVASPFEISHTERELKELTRFLKSLSGETKVIMEYTGKYYQPIARYLREAGIFVSVVNAILVHDYGGNSLRRVKTDRKDAIKIANYGIDRWVDLAEYTPEEDIRQMLKTLNRQYNQYIKVKVMFKNNLIALLDQTFPDVNRLFTSPARKDGHEKWVDFAAVFWQCRCVSDASEGTFNERYAKWCKKHRYNYSPVKAAEIYAKSCNLVSTLPKNDTAKLLVTQAIAQLNTIAETLAAIMTEMHRLTTLLPEYDIVMGMYGVGPTLGPQLIAEIGDVRRFYAKKALIAFAGLDSPPNQSGAFESKSRSMSKRGSASLRKTLFQVMSVILQNSPPDEPVFQFLDKKRAEGKHYGVYMMAAANKFLRIYYARTKEYLTNLDEAA